MHNSCKNLVPRPLCYVNGGSYDVAQGCLHTYQLYSQSFQWGHIAQRIRLVWAFDGRSSRSRFRMSVHRDMRPPGKLTKQRHQIERRFDFPEGCTARSRHSGTFCSPNPSFAGWSRSPHHAYYCEESQIRYLWVSEWSIYSKIQNWNCTPIKPLFSSVVLRCLVKVQPQYDISKWHKTLPYTFTSACVPTVQIR